MLVEVYNNETKRQVDAWEESDYAPNIGDKIITIPKAEKPKGYNGEKDIWTVVDRYCYKYHIKLFCNLIKSVR